ncbi:TetR family transcriptional regulator [Nocardia sp. 2]|uniref:TetR family transcriptional regulator n=1 Tax=Nocardia acididurans TaxID=2802282 RepID=A0ABS1MAX9_9NOCA|nr:TetR family transcriptional regulator [Nocardia acididurans]MBL1077290.1 TetR family transcriptional regulator [Nocardia acididurans]
MSGKTATSSTRAPRPDRATSTREAILTAAEQLFAEQGVFAISNRQVSEAAGQGNNAAVGYHFGTKADLVRAIVRKHNAFVEADRERLLTEYAGSTAIRDWVTCLIRPTTDHLATLGNPSYYARFCAQVMTDPTLRPILYTEALTSPALQRTLESWDACFPTLPPEIRSQRRDFGRLLLVHGCAEYERTLAEGSPTPHPTWQAFGANLIDATVAIYQAPLTPESR